MRRPTQTCPSDLRLLFHISELRAPQDGIDIIVVPDVWEPHVSEKRTKQYSWLKPLSAATDHDTRVFIFEYDIGPDEDGAVWRQLLAHGPGLLDAIRQARPCNLHRRPLFFICHGLGSVVLKQAMCLAHQDHPSTCHALAGIVFLGAPHLTSTDDTRWENWRSLLRLYRKELPKTALRPQDVEILAQLCQQFSNLDLQIPILSVYETLTTKLREPGPSRKTGKILVDKSHAAVQAEKEELFGVSASHTELHAVTPGSDLFNRLVVFFQSVPQNALAAVNAAYERLETGLDFSNSTFRSATGLVDFEQDREATADTSESKERVLLNSRGMDAAGFDVIPRARRLLLPCYSLGQPRNTTFYGRKQILDQVHDALAFPGETDPTVNGAEISAPSLPRVFIICSMGGMGKTEIAIEYMHSHKADFDAIFWVNSASEAKLNAGFRDVAVKPGLKNETDPRDDPIATRNIVKAWMSNPVRVWDLGSPGQVPDVRWLLVFDNVDDPDLLADFWPTDGAGSILITSRNPLVTLDISSELPAIDLPPMPIKEASLCLQKLSSREDERGGLETCAKIASQLGGLPLAIVQMYILQPSGHGLRDGMDFAVLSERVLESFAGEKDEARWTRLLADCYRYQGITGTYMSDPAAVTNCKRWLGVLIDRIEKYGDPVDVKTIPIAYNEIGMALMRVPNLAEAKRSWVMSCETLEQVTDPGELVFPFPWVHRALVAAYYSEDPESADSLITPILKRREEKLGVDDTPTIDPAQSVTFRQGYS
ncbi:P-loop containing nucleoside triphosphate hydrolase protein [Chaetomium sp. MPI-SDFR-AT-0129]|nr:P-loop containing nucleoside triphosphate hydrolase protein [Chaetomium sp. MPI-SDFR-AT-0129]